MATKPSNSLRRSYSRYGREAVAVLGRLIRIHPIERKLGIAELATRAGVSRDMMRRIEQGDPRCSIGLVFETAIIVGIALVERDRSRLSTLLVEQEEKLRLLPKAIHKPRIEAQDDF